MQNGPLKEKHIPPFQKASFLTQMWYKHHLLLYKLISNILNNFSALFVTITFTFLTKKNWFFFLFIPNFKKGQIDTPKSLSK